MQQVGANSVGKLNTLPASADMTNAHPVAFAGAAKLPWPKEAFPRVQLSDKDVAMYHDVCDRVLENALLEYEDFHGCVNKDRWSVVRQRQGLCVYRDHTRTKRGPNLMMCTGFIRGALEDVINGIYCDNTDDLRVVKTLLNSKFIDGASLAVVERRSSEFPFRFSGIKWFAAQSPGGKMIHDRDLLTYEVKNDRRSRLRRARGAHFVCF